MKHYTEWKPISTGKAQYALAKGRRSLCCLANFSVAGRATGTASKPSGERAIR